MIQHPPLSNQSIPHDSKRRICSKNLRSIRQNGPLKRNSLRSSPWPIPIFDLRSPYKNREYTKTSQEPYNYVRKVGGPMQCQDRNHSRKPKADYVVIATPKENPMWPDSVPCCQEHLEYTLQVWGGGAKDVVVLRLKDGCATRATSPDVGDLQWP